MKYLILTLGMAVSSISFSQSQSKEFYSRQLAQLNTDLAKDLGNLSLYYARADIYDVLDDFSRANSDYRKVLELYQRKPDSRFEGEFAKSCYRLADDYFFRQANKEKAMDYVEKGLKAAPGYKDLQILEVILIGQDADQFITASEKYWSLSLKYPDDFRLNMHYAKFLETSDPMEAIGTYEKALKADPSNEVALLSAAALYNNEATRLSEAVISDPSLIFEYKANPQTILKGCTSKILLTRRF